MPMGLELMVEAPPLTLTPIRTSVAAAGGAGKVSSSPKENNRCVTPKSEECRLRPALTCPPAPRKPRPATKRKADPPTSPQQPQQQQQRQPGFCLVPCDLLSLFEPATTTTASSSRPRQSKRIRVA